MDKLDLAGLGWALTLLWTYYWIKPHFEMLWNAVQHTVGQIKQSSLSSQDKLAQVSSELWTSNKLIFSLKRRQVHSGLHAAGPQLSSLLAGIL